MTCSISQEWKAATFNCLTSRLSPWFLDFGGIKSWWEERKEWGWYTPWEVETPQSSLHYFSPERCSASLWRNFLPHQMRLGLKILALPLPLWYNHLSLPCFIVKNSFSCARNMKILEKTWMGAWLYPEAQTMLLELCLFPTLSSACVCLESFCRHLAPAGSQEGHHRPKISYS